MKKLLFCFVAILLVNTALFSQPDLTSGIPIHYNYYLAELEDGDGLYYAYTPGEAALFTPFFVPELKKYAGSFLGYIEKMRSVTNYLGPLGSPIPESLGNYLPNEALKMIDNGTLEGSGRMFINVTEQETLTFREGSIFNDDVLFMKGDEVIQPKDTTYTEDLLTGEMHPAIVENNFDFYDEAIGAGFIEEWEYDRNKARFEKDIEYLQLHRAKTDEQTGEFRGFITVFNFKTGDFKKRFLDEEGLIKRAVESHVLFNLGFASTQDAMISAEMATTSMAHGYIEPSERYTLLLNIMKSVKEGQASLLEYDAVDFDPQTAPKAKPQDFFDALITRDTFYMEDLVTGEMHKNTSAVPSELSEVVGIRFLEDWYVDPDHFGVYKRVKGIVLLKEIRDQETGEVKGVGPYAPYYIKLNPRL